MRGSYHQKGFTLIELAGVMVIIGLLVGGIFVGRDLIKAAEIRATINQITMFDTAIYAFRLKYGCLPGDCDEDFGDPIQVMAQANPEPSAIELLKPISSAYATEDVIFFGGEQNPAIPFFQGGKNPVVGLDGAFGADLLQWYEQQIVNVNDVIEPSDPDYLPTQLYWKTIAVTQTPSGHSIHTLLEQANNDHVIDTTEAQVAIGVMDREGLLSGAENGIMPLKITTRSAAGGKGRWVPVTLKAENGSLIPRNGGYLWALDPLDDRVMTSRDAYAIDAKMDNGGPAPGAEPMKEIIFASPDNRILDISGPILEPDNSEVPGCTIKNPVDGRLVYDLTSSEPCLMTLVAKSSAF